MPAGIHERINKKTTFAIICFAIFAAGTVATIFIFKKDIIQLKECLDILKLQLQGSEVDKERSFVYICGKRLVMFAFIYSLSYYMRKEWLGKVLSFAFFFMFGIFTTGNVIAAGIKGLMSGFILMLPQWSLYMTICWVCIRQNSKKKRIRPLLRWELLIAMCIGIVLTALLETYVTLPLVRVFLLN